MLSPGKGRAVRGLRRAMDLRRGGYLHFPGRRQGRRDHARGGNVLPAAGGCEQEDDDEEDLEQYASSKQDRVIQVCAKFESELTELDPEEAEKIDEIWKDYEKYLGDERIR